MAKIKINFADEFTDYPGPRYIKQGKKSGEEFRKEILMPKYKEAKTQKEHLFIDMDGVYGYPPSFLEESFGGLLRETGDSEKEALKTIIIKCNARPYLIEEIKKIMKEAKEKKR